MLGRHKNYFDLLSALIFSVVLINIASGCSQNCRLCWSRVTNKCIYCQDNLYVSVKNIDQYAKNGGLCISDCPSESGKMNITFTLADGKNIHNGMICLSGNIYIYIFIYIYIYRWMDGCPKDGCDLLISKGGASNCSFNCECLGYQILRIRLLTGFYQQLSLLLL